MDILTTTADLATLCERLSTADFVTVDTEFMRDRTYWPVLCLIQLGGPDSTSIVDPMAEGMDLAPLYDFLVDETVVKVFHAARQDIEIFYHQSGKIPHPLFDTQVAAMACGYGDSVGYETLVAKLAKGKLDKSSRYTDWARRPLTDRQLKYAAEDVTYLRVVYERLLGKLEANGRSVWLAAEMEELESPATYDLSPENAWRRIKSRSRDPRFLAVLQKVAAWREIQAQTKDVPRNRVMKDDGLTELAAQRPADKDQLARLRGVPKGFERSSSAEDLLVAIRHGVELPEESLPEPPPAGKKQKVSTALLDLLKVFLKMKCEENGVAQKLVYNTADLELLAASDEAPIRLLKGWRFDMFGRDALALKHGKLGMAIDNGKIVLIEHIEE